MNKININLFPFLSFTSIYIHLIKKISCGDKIYFFIGEKIFIQYI